MATTTKKATSEKKTATKTSTKKSESIETKVVKPEPVAADRTAELEKLLKEQAHVIEALKKQISENKSTVSDKGEKVVFLWQAPVSDENIIEFGDRGRYGRIVGKMGTIIIPKNDLSQVMDAPIRYFLDKRWLVILSGLDEQEREMYGVNYKPNEYLSKEAFLNVVGVGKDMIELYPQLCDSHKEMVAKFYWEAWQEGRNIDRETVVALNKISKNEAFKAIIEAMNERDASAE